MAGRARMGLRTIRGGLFLTLGLFALALIAGCVGARTAPPPPQVEVTMPPPMAPPSPTEGAIARDGPPAGTAAAPAPRQAALPRFPWPPPRPSARYAVPRRDVVAGLSPQPSLGEVSRRIVGALEQAGYSEYSFYSAPGGFALVARLERINRDGRPAPEMFRFLDPNAEEPFSLTAYVQRLFFAPEGFYRQIVFVVNDEAFVASSQALSAEAAQALLSGGADRLPAAYDSLPFSGTHQVAALVYEYQKGAAEGDVATLRPGRLSGRQHLQGAGIAFGR